MSESEGCKVDRVVDEYGIDDSREGLEDIHDDLLVLWKGESTYEEHGYRSLADLFNRRLLKTVYESHDRVVIASNFDEEYETLKGQDSIERSELVDDLAQDGINVEEVLSDMVSWSTMRRHLIGCLDGEKSPRSAETNWERESVDIASDRLVEKVEKALSSWENKDEITGATDADVSVQIQLSCPVCPTRRSLKDALSQGYVCEDHLDAGG